MYNFAIKAGWRAVLANDITIYFNYVEATYVYHTLLHESSATFNTDESYEALYVTNDQFNLDDVRAFIRKLPYFITDELL